MSQNHSRKDIRLIDGQGRNIAVTSWVPETPLRQLVAVHGFSEHTRYYHSTMESLCSRGVLVHMMDLPGHGLSEGRRCHIDDFQEYLDNLDLLMRKNPNFIPEQPTFLLGHSLGGLIAAHYCLQKGHGVKGLILSSPLTGFSGITHQMAHWLVKFLAKNHRNQPYPKPAGVATLSRNPDMWDVYYSDALRGRTITPNLYLTMESQAKRLQEKAPELTLPLLIFKTAQDRVVSPDAIQRFFERAASQDKRLVVFSQAMHELFQEKEKDQIVEVLVPWMEQRD